MKYLLSVLLLLSVLMTGCASENSSSPDGPAPEFSLATHTGETFTLSNHAGTVVVINFWATWCKPCRDEIPEFMELQEEYGSEGLQFVGVSVDQKGFEAVRPFAERTNINYPLVMADSDVIENYGGVSVIPTTFIVGRNGRIRDRIIGRTTKTELLRVVRELLDESPGEVASTTE
jgi:cytochrome c biogenesis protein CcmG/thiol:disulfide interchange protein DsbE